MNTSSNGTVAVIDEPKTIVLAQPKTLTEKTFVAQVVPNLPFDARFLRAVDKKKGTNGELVVTYPRYVEIVENIVWSKLDREGKKEYNSKTAVQRKEHNDLIALNKAHLSTIQKIVQDRTARSAFTYRRNAQGHEKMTLTFKTDVKKVNSAMELAHAKAEANQLGKDNAAKNARIAELEAALAAKK